MGTNDLVLLREGAEEITDDLSIAQQMNLYFLSVFTWEQSVYLALILSKWQIMQHLLHC